MNLLDIKRLEEQITNLEDQLVRLLFETKNNRCPHLNEAESKVFDALVFARARLEWIKKAWKTRKAKLLPKLKKHLQNFAISHNLSNVELVDILKDLTENPQLLAEP
ncbi:MAG: hypothetical protein NZ932_03810 [Candidatus Bathyarchaeota archaeon]|nr:hypothetical protein [Candidatus Bathyarchaeota archaeon]MDW8022406.1 hypothetical protein [Nitrososphaerota archaeon]